MKIAILLPSPSKKPIGGFKIVYSYIKNIMNRREKYECTFYYILKATESNLVKRNLKYYYFKFLNKNFYAWSDIGDKAQHKLDIDHKAIKEADIIIATSALTAIYIKQHNLDKNKKVLYFIQHFENWALSDNEVISTYHYGFHNIVVSMWLKDILNKNNAPVALHIPNPIDEIFVVENPIEDRRIKSIFFMYHKLKWKGSSEALEAFEKLKSIDDSIEVSCFSAFSKPDGFPSWIKYYHKPSRNDLVNLYNQHAIFLSSSYMEGYGLPPAEAMGCGCCVLTTASGGINDFAIHNKTAYVINTPPNPEEIVTALLFLMDNKKLIHKFSKDGHSKIIDFTWDINTNKIIDLIENT